MSYSGICIDGPTPGAYVSQPDRRIRDGEGTLLYTHRVLTRFPGGKTLTAWVPPHHSSYVALGHLLNFYAETVVKGVPSE